MRSHQWNEKAPDLLPVLSRGKHRNPRKGACFMELASYLAGERWSDHPACAHPLLADLARQVNDLTSDGARDRLAPLIPSVIGLTGDDPRIDVVIARRAAAAALPVVSEERQRALAVSLLLTESVGAALDGRPEGSLTATGAEALAAAPLAEEWARRFIDAHRLPLRDYQRRSAPHAVRLSTTGIADACIPDPDGSLRQLLAGALDDVAALVRPAGEATAPRRPAPDQPAPDRPAPRDWAGLRREAVAARR